jgi:3-oxoacyl-[acyl-carrier-protein] synthase II
MMKISEATLLLLLVSLHSVGSFSLSNVGATGSGGRPTTTTALHMSSADPKTRVVVTGLGVISGCGIGADDFFDACVTGTSSLAVVTRFDAQYYPCRIASEVPDHMFVATDHFVNPKNAKSNDRYTHFAVAAARQALKDAGVGDTPDTLANPDRIGVMVGTAFGGMETFEQETLKLHKKPERPKVRDSIGSTNN